MSNIYPYDNVFGEDPADHGYAVCARCGALLVRSDHGWLTAEDLHGVEPEKRLCHHGAAHDVVETASPPAP